MSQQSQKNDEQNGPHDSKLAQIMALNKQSSINDIMSMTQYEDEYGHNEGYTEGGKSQANEFAS